MTDLEISDILKFLCRRGDLGYMNFKDEIGNDFLYTLVTDKKFYLALVLLDDLKRDYYNNGSIKLFCSMNKNRSTKVDETLPLTAHESGDNELRIVKFYINFIDEFLVDNHDELLSAVNDKYSDAYYKYRSRYRLEPKIIMEYLQQYIADFKKIIVSTSNYEEVIAFFNSSKLKYELASTLKSKLTTNTEMFYKALEDGLFNELLALYEDEKELLNTDSLYQKNSFYVALAAYESLVDKVIQNGRFIKTYSDDNDKEYTPLNIIFDKINNSDNHGYIIPLLKHLLSNENVNKNIMSKTLVYLFSNIYISAVRDIYYALTSQYDGYTDSFMNLFNEEIVKELISSSIKTIGIDASRSSHYEKVMKLIIKNMINELYIKFNNKNYTVDTSTILDNYSEVLGNKELADNIYADFLDNYLKMQNNASLNLDDVSQILFDKYCKDKNVVYAKKIL